MEVFAAPSGGSGAKRSVARGGSNAGCSGREAVSRIGEVVRCAVCGVGAATGDPCEAVRRCGVVCRSREQEENRAVLDRW